MFKKIKKVHYLRLGEYALKEEYNFKRLDEHRRLQGEPQTQHQLF